MKLSIFFSCFLFAVSVLNPGTMQESFAQSGHSGKTEVGRIDVIFNVSFESLAEKLPGKLSIYRCAPDRTIISKEQIRKMLGQKAHIEMHEASGGVFAGDMERLWAKAPSMTGKMDYPDQKDVLKKAETFLEGIGGISTKMETFRRVSYDSVEFSDGKGQRQTMTIGSNVTYRRLLDGIEVMGPGGKLKFFVGMDGEIAGFQRVWRDLEVVKKSAPLLPLQKAADMFRENPLGRALLSGVEKVEVNDIKLVYYERGISAPQEYLQPVYQFSCTAHMLKTDGKNVSLPYTTYIAALTEPSASLWPAGKRYEAGSRLKKLPQAGED